jgi:AhpD family alkylhydroperoxidase
MFNAPADFTELEGALKKMAGIIPGPINAQRNSMNTIESPGIIDKKTKILMCISVITYLRCEDCIALHVRKAVQTGITKQEILEAASVALSFGGGPSMGFMATKILPAIEKYEKQMANGTLTPDTGENLFK